MLRVEINGLPAEVADVHRVATWNYGHFTSMQVREGAVPGLELHLRRLAGASLELFGEAAVQDDARIRELIRHGLGDRSAASARVSVVPAVGSEDRTDVMVSVSDAVADSPRPALRVRTATYERDLPHLKHAATMGLTYGMLQAREAGFDDVLFVGRDGFVREGSVWNVSFWDGEQVLWPEAPMLPGITMQLLQAGLTRVGAPWSPRPLTANDLPELRAAAASNSQCPSQPLASIDRVAFSDGGSVLTEVLDRAWASVPWDVI
ncbi:aminotransferase class IV [Streptomyces sp. NPDC059957]|uniref:aminotransferase class IV n=1 Tax=Streptomyces sp. NPDC059957 TaxID=3347016 RepID=UPI0036646415